MKHCVCHVDFASHNLAETGAFFQQLFGWELKPHGDEYMLWDSGSPDRLGGGFELKNQAECGPDANRTLVYIAVEDVAAKLTQIESLGGTVIQPKAKIGGDYGYYGIFRDPQGTYIGLWSQN